MRSNRGGEKKSLCSFQSCRTAALLYVERFNPAKSCELAGGNFISWDLGMRNAGENSFQIQGGQEISVSKK